MTFSDLFQSPNSKTLLSFVNVLASSGLNKKHPELAILSLQIKRAIKPERAIDEEALTAIIDSYNSLSSEIKSLADSSAQIAFSGDLSYETGKEFTCHTDYITFSLNGLANINCKLLQEVENAAHKANHDLKHKTGPGNDFLGWMDLPNKNVAEIKETAEEVRKNSDAVVFIGIGGSYLGAKAVTSALLPDNFNLRAKELNIPEIYFAGQNLSTNYLSDLLKVLKGKKVTLVPISKSGTTTEPALAFRVLKEELTNAGNELNYVAITDGAKGALKDMAEKSNWKTFVIPDDVGGRFSVFSPVGLLPIAISGIDIEDLLNGAKSMMDIISNHNELEKNPALCYAVYRQTMALLGKNKEVLSSFNPYLTQVAEWWKQLYGESEGKDGKGIFVASTTFTTDLHSVGQLLQDGQRNFFESFLTVEEDNDQLEIKKCPHNLDNLNYLTGKSPDFVNQKAFEGTRGAHEFGEVPTMAIKLKSITPRAIGSLLQWWEYACGVSAYIDGVNPFNQPGVEEYKGRMFKLLGKP